MDFEFTMVFTVQSGNHVASVTKDRTGQFDTYLQVIDEQTGKRISDWLGSGAEAPAPTAPADDTEQLRATVIAMLDGDEKRQAMARKADRQRLEKMLAVLEEGR